MAFEITGNIHYGFATDTLIYAQVKNRALFDALPLPLDKASNENVLIKTNSIGPAQLIYQHWLNSPLDKGVSEK